MTGKQKTKLETQYRNRRQPPQKFEMDVKIRKRLRQLQGNEEVLNREITPDRILRELARIAFSNIKNYVNIENGVVSLRNIAEITDEEAAAIASIDVLRDGGVRLKLHDKMNALTTLSKWAGLLRDLNFIQNNNLQIVIQDLTTEAMKTQKDMELFSILNPENGNGN